MRYSISVLTEIKVFCVCVILSFMTAHISCAQTAIVKEYKIVDTNLLKEIISNLRSDSVKQQIKKYIHPNVRFKNWKYINRSI